MDDFHYIPSNNNGKCFDICCNHLLFWGFRVFGEFHDYEPMLVVATVEKDRLLRGSVAPVRRWVVEGRVARPGCGFPPSRDSPRLGAELGRFEDCECETRARTEEGVRKRRRRGRRESSRDERGEAASGEKSHGERLWFAFFSYLLLISILYFGWCPFGFGPISAFPRKR